MMFGLRSGKAASSAPAETTRPARKLSTRAALDRGAGPRHPGPDVPRRDPRRRHRPRAGEHRHLSQLSVHRRPRVRRIPRIARVPRRAGAQHRHVSLPLAGPRRDLGADVRSARPDLVDALRAPGPPVSPRHGPRRRLGRQAQRQDRDPQIGRRRRDVDGAARRLDGSAHGRGRLPYGRRAGAVSPGPHLARDGARSGEGARRLEALCDVGPCRRRPAAQVELDVQRAMRSRLVRVAVDRGQCGRGARRRGRRRSEDELSGKGPRGGRGTRRPRVPPARAPRRPQPFPRPGSTGRSSTSRGGRERTGTRSS